MARTKSCVLRRPALAPRIGRGYPYERLLALSRRDRLVNRISENVVPLGRDDDVLPLSGDVKLYSVVTEVRPTRWKLAICKAVSVAKRE